MSSEGSDIELPSALPKKVTKKIPTSPTEELLKKKKKPKQVAIDDPKKLSTKIMIHEALTDLKSRKGVSLYAIKKYLSEKYSVDTEKINYIIKKYLKKAVEEGTIVQTKGIGASGSFKLVPMKEIKKKKQTKPEKNKEEVKEKKKVKSKEKIKEKMKKPLEKSTKAKSKKETKSEENPTKMKKMASNDKVPKKIKIVAEKSKSKMSKQVKTPAKKKTMMAKRKSIGSIIKPPKMKPKAV